MHSPDEDGQILQQRLKAKLSFYHRLIEIMNIAENDKVLVLCTGPGLDAVTAAKRVGPHGSVLAVDQSEAMLRVANSLIARSRLGNTITCKLMDVTAPDLPREHFDHALCAFSLHYLQNLPAVLQKWRSLLRKGGCLGLALWEPPGPDPIFNAITAILREELPWVGSRQTVRLEAIVEELLNTAGFQIKDSLSISLALAYSSREHFMEALRNSPDIRPVTDLVAPETRDRIFGRIDALVQREYEQDTIVEEFNRARLLAAVRAD